MLSPTFCHTLFILQIIVYRHSRWEKNPDRNPWHFQRIYQNRQYQVNLTNNEFHNLSDSEEECLQDHANIILQI